MDDKEEKVSAIIIDCAYVAVDEGLVFKTDKEFEEFLEKIEKNKEVIDKIFEKNGEEHFTKDC